MSGQTSKISINEQDVQLTCEPPHDKTNKVAVRPAKTQISLGIRPVWSESSLCAQWIANDPRVFHADSEDSDQTGRMPRLICVSAGRTVIFWFFHETAHVILSSSIDLGTNYLKRFVYSILLRKVDSFKGWHGCQ